MNAVTATDEPAMDSRGLVATGLALATFMQVLDMTIANVSIPTIAGNLGVSTDQGTWVITSFAVANAISLPLTGRLMQRFGVVKVFVSSVALFTIASLLCGLAWSLHSLVFFRVLQGLVSGPMIPGSQALLLLIFPPSKKAVALTIWSTTTLVAPICGPILGGWISDNYSWPWIFFINVPIGAFCAYVCASGLRHRETPTAKLPVDVVGFVLLVVWVGALQLMLDTGKDRDWFASSLIVTEAVIAIIGFVSFIIWELGEKHPIVDLSLFRKRNFTLGLIPYTVGYGIFFGAVLILPLWLQNWFSYTATWAGLVAAPSGVVAVLLAAIFGKHFGRVDARTLATIGFVSFGASYLMRAAMTPDASFLWFVLPGLIQGVGMCVFFVAMINIMFEGVPPPDIPAASALSNFVRITAGSFSASIVTTFWDRHAAVHRSHLAEATTAWDPRMQHALGTLQDQGLSKLQSLGALTHMLDTQAYFLSAIDYFWISGYLTFAFIAFVWLTRRPHGGHAAAE